MDRKALLIGINYYDSDQELFGCINDVTQMSNMLVDAYGYHESNITILRDDKEDPSVRPTARNIVDNLRKILRSGAKEVWIHFSGHGFQVTDRNRDEKDRKDEVIIPCDYKTAGVITDDLLFSILNGTKSKVLLTMDCCNSGSNWDLPFRFETNDKNRYRRIIENRNYRRIRNRNIYMLSGCSDKDQSADSYNLKLEMHMGAFTMALMQTLRNSNHNNSILGVYVELNKMLKAAGYPQVSHLSSTSPYPTYQFFKSNTDLNDMYLSKYSRRRRGASRSMPFNVRKTVMSSIIGR